jgi:hypothetical protein
MFVKDDAAVDACASARARGTGFLAGALLVR